MPFVSENFKEKKTAVALGNFDGFHLGHMAVINSVKDKKNNGLIPLILKFREHPGAKLGKSTELLSHCAETADVKTVFYNFSDVCDMTPDEFVDIILVKELNAGFVACGYNYHFGKNAAGDSELLCKLCGAAGIDAFVCDAVCFENEPVSSSAIRKALAEGDIRKANGMLGYEYSYNYTVVSGDKRGRLLGAPTINQFFPNDTAVPKFGVYAARVNVDGKIYPAVTNIGLRPTIGNSLPRSETFIEGFSGDLYGKNPTVSLIEFLRPEKKFNSLDELSAQIASDAVRAAEIAGVNE